METELLFAKQTFCYGSHHFWVMSYGNRELSYQKTQTKQPLRILDNLFCNFLLADPLYTSHVLGLHLFCTSMNLITCEAAQAVLCWGFRVKYMIVCSLLYSVFNMSIVNWLIQDVLYAKKFPPPPLFISLFATHNPFLWLQGPSLIYIDSFSLYP